MSWYAVASVSGEELGALRSPGADLLDRFGGWHDPIPAVIAATEGGAIVRHASHDQEPLARWSAGRIALVGDAAHPMTANLGACQAIENAAILGHCLRTGGEVPDALRRYEAWRLPWSHMVSQRARRLSPVA